MTAGQSDPVRRVVPLLRTSTAAASAGEIGFNVGTKYGLKSLDDFRKRLKEELLLACETWERMPGVNAAFEFVELAAVAGKPSLASEPAQFLLEHSGIFRPGALVLPTSIIARHDQIRESRCIDKDSDEAEVLLLRRRVQSLKLCVRSNPRNGLAWNDLGVAYAELGEWVKAEQTLNTAILVTSGNRTSVRNQSRLHLHTGDAERARDVLKRSARLRFDPWVLAAELAANSVVGSTSQYTKLAEKISKDSNWSDFDLSELRAALSFVEFAYGADKKARKFLSAAMKSPTSNTFSQGEWFSANRYITSDYFEDLQSGSVEPAEALAIRFAAESKFDEAIPHFSAWLKDEPYSSRPAIDGSFYSVVALRDYDKALSFSAKGLIANPRSWLLWNNHAVAYFLSGRYDSGKRAYRLAKTLIDESPDITLKATEGLLEFKRGNIIAARNCYKLAIDHAEERKDFRSAHLASLFWAEQEFENGELTAAKQIFDEVSASLHQSDPIGSMQRHLYEKMRTISTGVS